MSSDGVWVALSYRATGRIEPFEVSDDLAILRNLQGHFPPGMPLKVRVLAVNTVAIDDARRDAAAAGGGKEGGKQQQQRTSTRLDLSLRPPQGASAAEPKQKKKGKAKAADAAQADWANDIVK